MTNALQALISSNAVPVTLDYRVVITINNQTPDDTEYAVFIRQLDPNGLVIDDPFIMVAVAGGVTTKTILLTDGQLISVAVTDPGNQYDEASVFVLIQLQRNKLQNAENYLFLTSGYISVGDAVSWPAIAPQPLDSIGGSLTNTTVTNPAAGAEITKSLSSQQKTSLVGGKFVLDTDANVANRRVRLLIKYNGNTFFSIPSRTTQAASLTYTYWLWTGPNLPSDQAPDVFLPLPETGLIIDLSMETATDDIQATDQFSAISLNYLRRLQTPY